MQPLLRPAMSAKGNAKIGPTGIVVDVDEYSANGSTMLKDIVKIIKNVFADKEGATCSVLSREVKVSVLLAFSFCVCF